MFHSAASETRKCVQVSSLQQTCDEAPHAYPSHTSLSLQPFSCHLSIQLDRGEFPVQTKPAPPSSIPPAPALLQMLSPPPPPLISHHWARCVRLPLAGINIRYSQLWAAHAETNACQCWLNRGCVLPKAHKKKAGTKKGEKGPSALKNSGFQVIVPICILNEGYVMVHGSPGWL